MGARMKNNGLTFQEMLILLTGIIILAICIGVAIIKVIAWFKIAIM